MAKCDQRNIIALQNIQRVFERLLKYLMVIIMEFKILMFPGRPYPTSHSQLKEVYAKYFTTRGHEITWIMPSEMKLDRSKMCYWHGVRIFVTPTISRSSFYKKVVNYFFDTIETIRITLRLIKTEKFDIIIVRNEILPGILAVYIKMRYKIPFCYQLASYFAEETIFNAKIGALKPSFLYHLKGKIEYIICKFIIRKANFIFPISEWMKQDMAKKGIPAKKMMAFPLGVSNSFYTQEVSRDDIKKKFKLNNPPTIIYLGTLNKIRNLDFLIRAFARAKKKVPNAKLLMVGAGENEDDLLQLKKLSQDLNLSENIIFTGHIPFSQVPEFLAAAMIGVSPIPPLNVFQVSSPTKLIEYMAMGKPVIGNDIADQKDVITKSGGGICTKYDEKEFARAIIYLLLNPEEAKEMGKKGYEWVEKNRDYKILAERLEKKYYEILQKTDYGGK